MKPKHAAAERYRRAEEAYLQRVQSRVEEEETGGTVFFAGPVETHPPELKLRDGRLTILRPETGDDCFDTQGFLLRRLETYRWDEKRLKLQGEFYYQSEEGLRYVDERRARVRRMTVTVRGPWVRQEQLRQFLKEAQLLAAQVEPTPPKELARGFLSSVFWPLAALGMFFLLLPGLVAEHFLYRSTTGSLLGFQQREGKHYPHYIFSLPDGTPVERVDTGVSLEDSVPPEEVDRLLRGRYPRKVQVQYLRSRPEKSTCRYL